MINEGLKYHLKNKLPLSDCVYRPGSQKFFEFFRNAKKNLNENYSDEDLDILSTDIGRFGVYEGNSVPLDLPIEVSIIESLEEGKKKKKSGTLYKGRKVKLNKPKRGGSKKFYVYVKNPKSGNVKKVSFGDTGLSVKFKKQGARASFAARHKCAQKKDKTKAGYWSCNIGRYWKSLGGSSNFSGYW